MNSPAVLWYYKDWIASTSHMRSYVRGWYAHLLAYQCELKALPDNIDDLASLAGVHPSEYELFKTTWNDILKEKFVKNGHGLVNLKMQKVIEENADKALVNRVNGSVPHIVTKYTKQLRIKKTEVKKLYAKIYNSLVYSEFENLSKTEINRKVDRLVHQTVNQTVHYNANEDVNVDEDIKIEEEEEDINTTEVPSSKRPDWETFKTYALQNQFHTDLHKLKLKYNAWVANGWKDGNNKDIINWQSKLLHTLEHLQSEKPAGQKNPPQEPEYENQDVASKLWGKMLSNIRSHIDQEQYNMLLDLTVYGYKDKMLCIKCKSVENLKKLEEFDFPDYYKAIFGKTKIQFFQ